MNNKLFIPEKIKAGYTKRSDTFTKKLAYVIYFDEKGVLRKEKSWEGWRDKTIEPEEFENKPYSGFTLNKGILRDGYWGGGHNMVRIYDDRGIEFEITISNLMYILMGNDCNKRVLSGDFVYAWDGTELVLLPTNTEEYKVSTTFTSLKTNKVPMKELQANVGCLFKTKSLEDWVYIGKLDQNYQKYNYLNHEYEHKREKKHVFYNLKTEKFEFEAGPARLAYCVDNNKVHNYEELLESYFQSKHFILVEEVIVDTTVGKDITEYFCAEKCHTPFKLAENGGYISILFTDNRGHYYSGGYARSVQYHKNLNSLVYSSGQYLYFDILPDEKTYSYNRYYGTSLEKLKSPDHNNGYTEYNVMNRGLTFKTFELSVKTTDGKHIKITDDTEIRTYFFVKENLKTTIIK